MKKMNSLHFGAGDGRIQLTHPHTESGRANDHLHLYAHKGISIPIPFEPVEEKRKGAVNTFHPLNRSAAGLNVESKAKMNILLNISKRVEYGFQ
jgi:hypothetical protein